MVSRLFSIAALFSLLLCVAMCGLWARSYRVGDGLSGYGQFRQVAVTSRRGELMYFDHTSPPELAVFLQQNQTEVPIRWSYDASVGIPTPDSGNDTRLHRLGISDWREKVPVPVFANQPLFVSTTRIVVPHWLLALLLALLPAARLLRGCRGRRNARAGSLCGSCGYDLRASTVRCPECGTPITRSQSAGE